MFSAITPQTGVRAAGEAPAGLGQGETEESIPMRKTLAKAVTWRLIGTAEIFAISFWTTGHVATAGHTAAIAAITSIIMYVAHELAWEAGLKESLCLYWDNRPARCLRPDLVSSEEAAEHIKALVGAEPDR
jgi:uncharacterized membrane protein